MDGAGAAFLAIPEALALGAIAAGTGRRICRRLLPGATVLEHSVFGYPVGMALLSLLMTALLFARVPARALPYVLGAGLAAAAGWARRDVAGLARDLGAFARGCPALSIVLGVSALVGAIGCLAPETGWDTGVYHFAMARLRAEQGAMVVRMDVPHGFRPAFLESMHAAGFVLSGEALASLINESFYFAGAALVRLWGLRLGGPRGGLFAAFAWLSSVTYVLRMDGGDVEVAQAVYFGVAILALIKIRDGEGGHWRLLVGLAVGMLVGMKYASCFLVVSMAAVWGIRRFLDRASWSAVMADAVVIGGLGILIAGPWYLRNKIATGVFFYPFQSTSFNAPGEGSAAASASAVFRSLGMDVFILVGAAAIAGGAVKRDGWAGAVPLLLLPWLIRQVGGGWAESTNAVRYAAPSWLPLFPFGGVLLARAVERGPLPRILAVATLLGPLCLGQGVLLRRNLPKLPAALGLVSREAFRESRISTYRAIREAEAGLSAGKRILLVEERVYYCRAPFLAASDIQIAVDFSRIRSAADLRGFLREESIGAIVVDRTPNAKTSRFRDLERRLGPDWPPSGVRAVPVPGDASLYRVED